MPDAELDLLLRAVLDEVCADIPRFEIATRERVAARLREAAQRDSRSFEDLRQAGRDALISAPTMWR